MPIAVARICRYPVKGLSADEIESVDLVPGEGLPHDRRFALARAATRFDPAAPRWLPKTSFLSLARHERLAALATRFDPASGILVIRHGNHELARARITEAIGQAIVEDFFAAYLGAEAHGKPHLCAAPGHAFSDHDGKVVSIVGLASVRDLERIAGAAVDPLRFRANLYLDGAEPWAEFAWLGREIAVGAARLKVTGRVDRCAATSVNPATAMRDMNVPNLLQRGFGHVDLGVYATVVGGGAVVRGAAVVPAPAAGRDSVIESTKPD